MKMDFRKKILKTLYPLIMKLTKGTDKGTVLQNEEKVAPKVPFFQLKTTRNNGLPIDFSQFEGKKVLVVNTASDCGFTNQYSELQKLYEQEKDKLVIIGFPANDFKEQEKGTDKEIAEFCKINYGIKFPLAAKSSVIKGKQQNEIFKWLSDETLNGWNDQEPTWNFCKYLVDEDGKLIKFFDTGVSPLSDEIKNAIEL